MKRATTWYSVQLAAETDEEAKLLNALRDSLQAPAVYGYEDAEVREVCVDDSGLTGFKAGDIEGCPATLELFR